MRQEFNSFEKGQNVREVMYQPKHQEFLARMAFNLALSNWENNPGNWGYNSHAEMYEDRENLYQYESCRGNDTKKLTLCYDYETYDLIRAIEECYLNAEYTLECYLEGVLNEHSI